MLIAVQLGLSSCTAYRPGQSSSDAYHDVRQGEKLVMSPGLVQSANRSEQLRIANSTLLPIVKGANVLHDGNNYYAFISASPEITWERLIEYLQRFDFRVLAKDDLTGLIETDWRAARSDKDGAAGRISSRVKSLFGASEVQLMERFVFRLQRVDRGSRLYVSHRRAEQTRKGLSTQLVPQAGDPQIEAALLQRFLVYLGFGQKMPLATQSAALAVQELPSTMAVTPEIGVQAPAGVAYVEAEQQTSVNMPGVAIEVESMALAPIYTSASTPSVDVASDTQAFSLGAEGIELRGTVDQGFERARLAVRKMGFKIFATQADKGLFAIKAGLMRNTKLSVYSDLVGAKRWAPPELIVQVRDMGSSSHIRLLRRDKTVLGNDSLVAFYQLFEDALSQ